MKAFPIALRVRTAVLTAIALLACVIALPVASAYGATIWTDADGDGLPDASTPFDALVGDEVTVDIWIDSEGFVWSNFLAYVEWTAGISYVSGAYIISGGSNFTIDDYSHPRGVGFGGYGYENQGVERVAQVTLSMDAGGVKCLTPIIDPKSTYGVFSQLGRGEDYRLFSRTPTCWNVTAPPQPAACCYLDGSCENLFAEECTTAGGVPHEEGTCATVACPPPPTVACCFFNGSCSDLTESQCEAQSGTPGDAASSCSTTNCPPPPTPSAAHSTCSLTVTSSGCRTPGCVAGNVVRLCPKGDWDVATLAITVRDSSNVPISGITVRAGSESATLRLHATNPATAITNATGDATLVVHTASGNGRVGVCASGVNLYSFEVRTPDVARGTTPATCGLLCSGTSFVVGADIINPGCGFIRNFGAVSDTNAVYDLNCSGTVNAFDINGGACPTIGPGVLQHFGHGGPITCTTCP